MLNSAGPTNQPCNPSVVQCRPDPSSEGHMASLGANSSGGSASNNLPSWNPNGRHHAHMDSMSFMGPTSQFMSYVS